MLIYIRNSSETLVPVNVRRGDSIAGLKAAYRREPGFAGNRCVIELLGKLP